MFRENDTMAHILMAKLIRALELHYPMIQFVILYYSFIIGTMFFWIFYPFISSPPAGTSKKRFYG